jgi:hypothetical protein
VQASSDRDCSRCDHRTRQSGLARLVPSSNTESKSDEALASSTDVDATVMKMADGGSRPPYNAQLASDCAAQVISVCYRTSRSSFLMASFAHRSGLMQSHIAARSS